MSIYLIAVGKKMPSWVEQGYSEYAKRLPHDFNINLIEIEPAQRSNKNFDVQRALLQEEERILKAIPDNSLVVALAIVGQSWDTPTLAQKIDQWRQTHQHICFLIGGPEGLSDNCIKKAQIKWSLSALTLPHPLVRVLFAEQFYRAYSLINNHPYHR